MSLTETYSTVRVGKNVSDGFHIRNDLKQGDALSSMLFNFALEYAIRRFQVNQDGFKVNGTHQLLAYADDVNILGGSIHTVKENAEAVVAAAREIGLEVVADKAKYMVMSRDQNAGRIHSVRMNNSTFERVESINIWEQLQQIKILLRKKLRGNACYYSVQNLLSSRLLSKNLKIKIYRTIILPVVLYGCETWSLTLREERKLRLFRIRC